MYREQTQNFEVAVEPEFLPEHSSIQHHQYVFSYRIRITNHGEKAAQLLSRHWIITDGQGKTHEVKGEGVVGEQPLIPPGESYEYSSFCPLTTPTGNMRGKYQMMNEQGETFQVKIPLFFLRDMRNLH